MPVFGVPTIFEGPYRDVHDKPIVALGGCYVSNVDDVPMTFVRFSEAVKEGDVVQTKYNHHAPTFAANQVVAAGTQRIEIAGANFKTHLAGIPEEPTLRDYAIIAITAGNGAGLRGYITHYTDTVLNIRWYDTDDGTLKSVIGDDGSSEIGTTSVLDIYAPWYVKKAISNASGSNGANKNASRGTANGIVLARSAKKDQYGFIGIEGDLPVRVGEDVVAGAVLVPGVGTGAGMGYNIKPPDVTGSSEANDAGDSIPPFATVHHALDYSDASGPGNNLVQATVYCRKISIVKEIAESLIEGTPRPEAV